MSPAGTTPGDEGETDARADTGRVAGWAPLNAETVRHDLLVGRSAGRYIEGVRFVPDPASG